MFDISWVFRNLIKSSPATSSNVSYEPFSILGNFGWYIFPRDYVFPTIARFPRREFVWRTKDRVQAQHLIFDYCNRTVPLSDSLFHLPRVFRSAQKVFCTVIESTTNRPRILSTNKEHGSRSNEIFFVEKRRRFNYIWSFSCQVNLSIQIFVMTK